jgi:putative membrane protein (TIGR04086 family)
MFRWQLSWGVKGVGFSLLFALLSCFLFALFLRFIPLDYGGILTGACIIKAVCILLACCLSIRESKGWAKGLFIGGMTIIATRFVFLVFTGVSFWGEYLLFDLLFGLAVGFLSGILAVHCKR